MADGADPEGDHRRDGPAPEEADDGEPDPDVYYESSEEFAIPTSSYTPVAYDNLQPAPRSEDHPDPGTGGSFRLLNLPKVPKLKYLVGPSAIMLGASLGSGETLFWPQLVARFGWSIYWIFALGVLVQYVVNTEIQRWTLATGESIFRGFERLHPVVPLLLMFGGFVSLGWPGWAASAAKVGAAGLSAGTYRLLGLEVAGWRLLGIALMVFIWITYQVTPLMYNVVERLQIVLVALSIAFAAALFALIVRPADLSGLAASTAGISQDPSLSTAAILLGAIAYAGAGGYLNLSQSLWAREKGYAMGRYQGRIKNPFAGDEPEDVHENGFSFQPSARNLKRWRSWWRVTQLEHLLTFVLGLGLVTTGLSIITVTRAAGTTRTAVDMWLVGIAPAVGPLASSVIYVTLFLALFTTEYAIIESFVRNSSDVIYELYGREAGWSLPRLFWTVLTVFCAWGVFILLLPISIEDPFGLLVVGAAMSGLMMWPYVVMVQLLNTERLPEQTMPGWARTLVTWIASAFFGYFTVLLVGTYLDTQLGVGAFAVETVILGSGPGGYALWLGYIAVEFLLVVRTVRAKRSAAGTVENADEAWGLFS